MPIFSFSYLIFFSAIIFALILLFSLVIIILRQQTRYNAEQQQALTALREFTLNALNQQQNQDRTHSERLQQSLTQSLHQLNHATDYRLREQHKSQLQSQQTLLTHLVRLNHSQQYLHQLADNVEQLSKVLVDKRSRGAFGEQQLQTLIANILPPTQVNFQYTLKSGLRPDCAITLPAPDGKLCIDAKFPLESYRKWQENNDANALKQLRLDMKRHIQAISEKYIQPPETATGAVLFLPAEAIFADLHRHLSDVIALAQEKNVWITSPTTLAATLTLLRSALKDDAVSRHAREIHRELQQLKQEFDAFQHSIEQLQRHIDLSCRHVNEARLSAQSISKRFDNIDRIGEF